MRFDIHIKMRFSYRDIQGKGPSQIISVSRLEPIDSL